MTMTNVCHIVVCIEILDAICIVEILHRTAHDVQWLFVRDTQITTEQPVSRFNQCFYPCHIRGKLFSIALWLIRKYSFSGCSRNCFAAMQTLIASRKRTKGHNISSSSSSNSNSLV